MRISIRLAAMLLTSFILFEGVAATTSQSVISNFADRQSKLSKILKTTHTLSFLVHQARHSKPRPKSAQKARDISDASTAAQQKSSSTTAIQSPEELRQNNYMYMEQTVSPEGSIWEYGEKVADKKNVTPKLQFAIFAGTAEGVDFKLDIASGARVILAQSSKLLNPDTFHFGTLSPGTMKLITQLNEDNAPPVGLSADTETSDEFVTCTLTIGSSAIVLVSNSSGDLLSENFAMSTGITLSDSTFTDYKTDPALGGLRFPQTIQIAEISNPASKERNLKEFRRTDSITWDTESFGNRVKRLGLEGAIKELTCKEGFSFEVMKGAELPEHLMKYVTPQTRK